VECCKSSPQLQDLQGALHSIVKLEELSGGMDRMFESEEYAEQFKFVGYRRVGRTRQSFRESTFTNVRRQLILENTRAVILETCIWAEL